MNDPLGAWSYDHVKGPKSYGNDMTYQKAMEYLDDCKVLEDWGCGTAYAWKFRAPEKIYIGIDGSPSQFNDRMADLRNYRSKADGILMRHVLEHNFEWRKILENALSSFRQRMVIINFIPLFKGQDKVLAVNFTGTADIALSETDFMGLIKPFYYHDEVCQTIIQYGPERIFYLKKGKQ